MRFLRRGALIPITLISIFLTGCGGNAGDGANNANSGVSSIASNTNKENTNAEELGMLISFAWETEDLAWKKDEGKKSLTAAFRLSPEDAKKLSDQLTAKGQGAPKEVSVEDWFPAELIAQGESRGGSTVPATAYPADDLYQPPYNQGTISRIEGTGYFVVEVHAQ
jgi:hypothetical protein